MIYIILATLLFHVVVSNPSNQSSSTICNISSEDQSLSCHINLTFVVKSLVVKCDYLSNNSILISVSKEIEDRSILDSSFSCMSNSLLSFKVNFEDDQPTIKNAHIWQHRVVKHYSDIHSYKTKIGFAIPTNDKLFNSNDTVTIYTITGKNGPSSEVNVVFELIRYPDLYLKSRPSLWCHVYSLTKSNTIDGSLETAILPCITFRDVTGLVLQRFEDTTINSQPITEEFSYKYDNLTGFHIRSKHNLSGKFACRCVSDTKTRKSYEKVFSLKTPDVQYFPKSKYLDIRNNDFQLLKKDENKNIKLTCSSISRKVKMGLFRMSPYTSDGEGTDIREVLGYNNVNVTFRKYQVNRTQTRYYASAEVPSLTPAQRQKVLKLWKKRSSSDYLRLEIDCVNAYNSSSIMSWIIIYERSALLYYSQKHKAFVCETPELGFGFFESIHPIYVDNTLSLRQVDCNNIYQCQLLSKCLEESLDTVSRNFVSDFENSPCRKLFIASRSDCDDFGITDRNTTIRFKNSDAHQLTRSCGVLQPRLRGIVQCFSLKTSETFTNTQNSVLANNNTLILDIRQTYFVGFDGHLYTTELPPKDAILKLTSLSNEKLYYTNGTFRFRCEAHSFFYEDGIHWFLVYVDGSSKELTNETSTILHFPNVDEYNPESNIEVFFSDDQIVGIVCSAPTFNSTEWQNATLIFKVEISIPSKITTAESNIYFKEGNKGESVTCLARGIPRPQIIWTIPGNQKIEEPLTILDSNILLFRNYTSSMAGKYICTATNAAGNDSKTFNIGTFIETEEFVGSGKFYYTVVGAAIFLSALIIIIVFAYLRGQKMKRYQEMKEIIRWFDGIQEKVSQEEQLDDDNDILQTSFNSNYEIKKNSFFIDRKKLLGKGEFGEVYKGLLEGTEGAVAFKTVAKNASVENLKALVSELKILIYIGPHENLITLIGAYREEISQGVLIIAMELCDLGSLQSYLRSYKHLFLKSASIKSNEYENIKSSSAVDKFNLHSKLTLLKWSSQIASGMEYLATKNVVHTDLASRNVLLTAEANAKITDFGLSRRTYTESEYKKTGKDPLPWKWLAIESLLTNTFSEKSDVWSYGITLWEIFSFGEVPYPGIAPSQEFVQQLENGLRNNQPKYASDELFHLMNLCWLSDPKDRPTFTTLRMIFQNAIFESKDNIDVKVSQNLNIQETAIELASSHYLKLTNDIEDETKV